MKAASFVGQHFIHVKGGAPFTEGQNVASLSKCFKCFTFQQSVSLGNWTHKMNWNLPIATLRGDLLNPLKLSHWVVCSGRLMVAKNTSIHQAGFVWYCEVHSKEGLMFETSAVSLNYLKHIISLIFIILYSVQNSLIVLSKELILSSITKLLLHQRKLENSSLVR